MNSVGVNVNYCNISEIFHANRWHAEFAAPMIVLNKEHIYVNDFIIFHHPLFNQTIGKVLKFFKKVLFYSV